MQFHPTQSIVARDTHRFRVVCCGRQWGKTTLAVWEMLGVAYSKNGKRVGYFAPTFTQARDIAWAMLKEATKPVQSRPPNETRLELYIRTQDGGESEIVLKGFESIESVRGTQFDFLVLDEVAKMRHFQEGWEAVLLGTLVYRNGQVLFISTPYGYNHFHKLYLQGMETKDFSSYKFTSYDNPFLGKDVLELVKNTSTPDYFSQEYMAEFTRFTGLIYKEFNAEEHIHDFDNEGLGDYYFGQDFAVRGYTAMLVIKVKTNGDIYILDEYKEEGLVASEHIEKERLILKKYADLDRYVGYADPAGYAKNQQKGDMLWSLADEYLEQGFPIVPANNEVIAGINYVRQLFKNNRIHIHPRCTKLLEELLQYQWKDKGEKSDVNDPEEVRKLNDHLVDALRYALYSKPTAPIEEEKVGGMPLKFELKIEEDNPNKDEIEPIETLSYYD